MVANKSVIERSFDLICAKVSIKERNNFLGGPRGVGDSVGAIINIKKNKFDITVEKGTGLQIGIISPREKQLYFSIHTKRETAVYMCYHDGKKWTSHMVYSVSKKRRVHMLFGTVYEEKDFKRFQKLHPEKAKHARVEYI